jgi:CRP-like cAMP-binding protein
LVEGELLAYSRNELGDELALKRISAKGSFFGEIAFLTAPRALRTAGIRALSDSRLLRIPGEAFESWLQRNRALEERLRHLAARQIRELVSQQLPLLRNLQTQPGPQVCEEVSWRTYHGGSRCSGSL